MSTDTIRIMCPALSCRRVLAVPVSFRGKNVRCKNCGATIGIPEKALAPAPVAAAAAPADAAPAAQAPAPAAKAA